MCAAEGSWIGKAPMQPLGDTREYRTTFCAGFIADGDHEWEKFSSFKNIKDRLRLLSGDINSHLAHGFHCERVERAGFQPGAVCFKIIRANEIEKSFCHLTACTVVDADEQDFLFHDLVIRFSLVAETAAGPQQLSRSRVSFLKSRANIASGCTQSCRHLRFVSSSRDRFFGNE